MVPSCPCPHVSLGSVLSEPRLFPTVTGAWTPLPALRPGPSVRMSPGAPRSRPWPLRLPSASSPQLVPSKWPRGSARRPSSAPRTLERIRPAARSPRRPCAASFGVFGQQVGGGFSSWWLRGDLISNLCFSVLLQWSRTAFILKSKLGGEGEWEEGLGCRLLLFSKNSPDFPEIILCQK